MSVSCECWVLSGKRSLRRTDHSSGVWCVWVWSWSLDFEKTLNPRGCCNIKKEKALFLLWHSYLRHCATSRKFAGSIPDGVVENFHWINHSCRTMALGSTQPQRKMRTRGISWNEAGSVKGGRCVGLTTLPLSWASTSWNPKGLSRPFIVIEYNTMCLG